MQTRKKKEKKKHYIETIRKYEGELLKKLKEKEKHILMLLYLSHKHTEIVNTHILMLIYSVEIIDSKHATRGIL